MVSEGIYLGSMTRSLPSTEMVHSVQYCDTPTVSC